MNILGSCSRGDEDVLPLAPFTAADVRWTMARPNLQLQFARSPVPRYGFAATSCAVALSLVLLGQRYGFDNLETPLFLFAVAVTVWYAGTGPAILVVVLSSLAFDYFFTEPRFTFYVTSSELPYYVVLILFALLLTWFSAVRRRVEQQLLQSRDELQRGGSSSIDRIRPENA
jgi:K+-sensing histidine kinase KdpD